MSIPARAIRLALLQSAVAKRFGWKESYIDTIGWVSKREDETGKTLLMYIDTPFARIIVRPHVIERPIHAALMSPEENEEIWMLLYKVRLQLILEGSAT